jgi:hypothetical protein
MQWKQLAQREWEEEEEEEEECKQEQLVSPCLLCKHATTACTNPRHSQPACAALVLPSVSFFSARFLGRELRCSLFFSPRATKSSKQRKP